MSWSFPIARVFGSEIRIHVTFFLLLAWIGAAHFVAGGAPEAFRGIALILAIFACIIAHEFGHALTARLFGIRTPDITLLPIGGLARLERMPEKPRQEIAVALAGPMVNVVIAVVIVVFVGARVDPAALATLDSPATSFAAQVATINIFLVVFNLIPAFPMDGGRVLRALLAMKYSRVDATNIAARIGQGLAFVFGFLGLMGNPLLIFIAVFVYIAAGAEAHAAKLLDLARQVGVREAMIDRFASLRQDATANDAVDCLLRTTQHEFPVVDDDSRLVGVLDRQTLVKALDQSGVETPVADIMVRNVPTVRPEDRLEAALRDLEAGSSPVVAVVDRAGRLIGYITTENVGELMATRAALPKRF